MAKVAFSKLKLTKQDTVKTIKVNDIEIEVKQYLPLEEKINIVTTVLEGSADGNNFANPMKVEVLLNLEMIFAYTNLSFTEKQKEDLVKLYDILESNGVIDIIINSIPEEEYNALILWTDETIKAFYNFRASALGLFEAIVDDYSRTDMDVTALQEKIGNPENLKLLKGVMNELG